MLLVAPQLETPQIFADIDIGIASYEPTIIKTGDNYYLRHFLISDKHSNTQGWRVENLQEYVKTFIGKPLIVAPGFHHLADLDKNTWLKIQEPYAIGSMVDVVFNPTYGSYDAITHVTKEEAKLALEKGIVPPFTSPAIHGTFRFDGDVKVFTNWEGMQSAVVLKPAFRPIDMARIKPVGCTGDKYLCRKELIAIAEDGYNLDNLIKNNFTTLNNTNGKNDSDNNMTGEQPTGSNHVDTLLNKFQNELAEEKRQRELEVEKNKQLAESLKKIQDEKDSVVKERDTYKTKTDSYEKEKQKSELKKTIEDKLRRTKLFFNDADLRSKKVDEFVNKGFKPEDLDVVYDGQFMTEDELKEAEAKLKEQSETKTTKDVGIAEDVTTTSLPTKKPNAKLLEGVAIMDEILELRL